MNFDNRGVIVADCSFYQDDDRTPQKIDFRKMKAAGVRGVILRAGQNTWEDEDFKDYYQAAKAAGLPRGTYWFFDSRNSPVTQANIWQAQVGNDLPELGFWHDFEESYNGVYKGERYWKQLVLTMEAFYPVSLHGVYTANWWWNAQVVREPWFWVKYPLWVAQYNVTQADVILPAPWRGGEAVLWQYTASGDGAKYGVESKEIDLNYFNGDESRFQSYFKVTSGDPIPPREEGIMYRYEAKNLYPNMSLRSDHNTGSITQRQFTAGATWKGNTVWTASEDAYLENGTQINKAGDRWLQVELVNGGAYSGWVAIEHLGRKYCDLTDSYPTPEPPSTFPPRVGLTIGSETRYYVPE